jgi:hypothetical protein
LFRSTLHRGNPNPNTLEFIVPIACDDPRERGSERKYPGKKMTDFARKK